VIDYRPEASTAEFKGDIPQTCRAGVCNSRISWHIVARVLRSSSSLGALFPVIAITARG
jgi:hypothetical protein